MPTRQLVLTHDQADLIERLVASGRYESEDAVLREGLRLIEGRETQDEARLLALRDAARVGVADIEAGRYRSFESPAELSRHLAAIAAEAITGKAIGTGTE